MKRKPRYVTIDEFREFNPWLFSLKSCRVYDGDTLMEMVLDLGFGVSFETTGRLFGINAPEVRGKTKGDGVKSRDWLKAALDAARAVHVGTVTEKVSRQKGKYGRWLVTVWADGVNLNDEMVRIGYAKRAKY